MILKERNGTWNVKSNGSNTTAKAPCRRLKRQLREPPHRFVNSASVNRTAPYGKTGWATSIGSVTGMGVSDGGPGQLGTSTFLNSTDFGPYTAVADS